MRNNKVYIIRGYANLASRITAAEFERINMDHVLLITALRRPQFLPTEIRLDPNSIMLEYKKIMDHWRVIDQEYFLTAEYGNVVLDHGGDDVKAVEGEPLRIQWFFDIIKAVHKSFGQSVVEVEVLCDKHSFLRIDGEELDLKSAVDRFGSHHLFG